VTPVPEALFITCSDSRIDPCLLTHSKPGDIFICRNAGNIVPAYGEAMGGVSATIEYAVPGLGVKDVILCGHSDCGAMRALLDPPSVAQMPAVAAGPAHGELNLHGWVYDIGSGEVRGLPDRNGSTDAVTASADIQTIKPRFETQTDEVDDRAHGSDVAAGCARDGGTEGVPGR
jgi:carbonic anhydrase